MSIVIPPNRTEVRPNQIDWLDMKKVSMASRTQVQANKSTMAKTASASNNNKIVHSYGCSCGKKWSSDNEAFTSQINLAKRAGKKSVDLACPSCGRDVFPLDSIRRSAGKDESRSSAIFAAKDTNLQTTSSTYNTFIDRHVVFKATQALQNFASKMGMHMPRAKYIQGVHTKEAGFDTPIITSFSAEIEWNYGRNQKMRVMANVGVDAAGKIKMPKVFKTADYQEHPFDKDYIVAMQKNVSPKMMGDTRRKTDLPQYRKSDPSRFRAVAALNKKAGKLTIKGLDIPELENVEGTTVKRGLRDDHGEIYTIIKLDKPRIDLAEDYTNFLPNDNESSADYNEIASQNLGQYVSIYNYDVVRPGNRLSSSLNNEKVDPKAESSDPENTSPSEESQEQLQSKIEANLHVSNGSTLNVLPGATAILLTNKTGLRTVAFQVNNKEVRIDMQARDFNRLFKRAGSYDDFLNNYTEEISQASSYLSKLHSISTDLDEETDSAVITKAGDPYDRLVVDSIEHWIFSGNFSINEIVSEAIQNQDRTGTEPQMLLYAIEDIYNALSRNHPTLNA